MNFFNRVFFITLSPRKTGWLHWCRRCADMKIFINIKQCQDRDIGQHSRVSTEYWWLSSAGHYYQYRSCWTSLVCQPNWQQFILICRAIIKTVTRLIYLLVRRPWTESLSKLIAGRSKVREQLNKILLSSSDHQYYFCPNNISLWLMARGGVEGCLDGIIKQFIK